MLDLTFGEQVKIILSRKGMTIKELAEMIEEHTGKKMSRQNLTQRLGRDNFQEQDMRMIAQILECPFQLNILGDGKQPEQDREDNTGVTEAEIRSIEKKKKTKRHHKAPERDITIGELVDINEGLEELLEEKEAAMGEIPEEMISAAGETVYSVEEQPEPEEEQSVSAAEEPFEPEMEDKSEPEAEEHTEPDVEEKAEPDIEEQPEAEAEEQPEPETEEYPETVMEEQPEAQEHQTSQPEEHKAEVPAREKKEDKPAKKTRGSWRDFFQRRSKKEVKAPEPEEIQEPEKEEEPAETAREEEPQTEVYIQEESEKEELTEEFRAEEAADEEEDLERGDINPYTGHEYESNTVRMHPKRIGYVQVYDRSSHQWTDMTEWAFLGYQERKKALLGNDYEPPIYLD